MQDKGKGIVLSLYDYSGNMVEPWASEGYRCICVDIDHDGIAEEGNIKYIEADLTDSYLPPRADYEIAFAFPPCTHTAVSGARWFQAKGLEKLEGSIEKVRIARQILEWTDAPWMLEHPVSVLSTHWREPDYVFHPYEYDGYTEEDNAYSKKTCLWTSDDFMMPDKLPVEDYDDRIHKMPPSEDRSKKRSKTPMGFAKAVFEANRER